MEVTVELKGKGWEFRAPSGQIFFLKSNLCSWVGVKYVDVCEFMSKVVLYVYIREYNHVCLHMCI